jgi:sec-independent protein translocase protein TatA
MGAFSIWHWIVVLGIVLLVFGPGRLGNLGRDLGKSIKEFKSAMNDTDITPTATTTTPTTTRIEDHGTQAQSTVNQSEKTKA